MTDQRMPHTYRKTQKKTNVKTYTIEQVRDFAVRAATGAFDLCGSMQDAIRDTFADYGFKATEQDVGDILIRAHQQINPRKW